MHSLAKQSSADELAAFRGSLRPMTDCPRFQRCSAPVCPLDREMPNRDGRIDGRATGGIREPRCALPRAKREALGVALPWRGLWPTERAALERWERMSPQDRRQFVARGEESRKQPAFSS